MTRAPLIPFLLLAALAGCKAAPEGNAANASTATAAASTTIPLVVQSAAPHNFTVEIALTEAQQEKGLMFRKELGPDKGMLFPFAAPRAPSFWMKNTLIPLDMLVIAPDGRISTIFANREPYSLEPSSTAQPAVAVLEIPGGRAAQLGIRVGDTVRWGQCPGTGTRPGEAWDRLSFCP